MIAMDTPEWCLNIAFVLAFAVLMHLISLGVALLLKRQQLALVSQSFVTGAAAGCALYSLLPAKDSLIASALVSAMTGGVSMYLTTLLMKSKRG